MRHPLRWVVGGVATVVAILAAVLALTVGTNPRAEENRSVLVGKPAPPFQVSTLDGSTLSSRDLAGKTVVVNFWNSWCLPCREEHAALTQWYERHRADPGLALVGIVREDTDDAVRSYARAEHVDWPVGIGSGAKQAALDFGTRGQPETYAVGPDGVVAGSYFGPVTPTILDELVARARGTA